MEYIIQIAKDINKINLEMKIEPNAPIKSISPNLKSITS